MLGRNGDLERLLQAVVCAEELEVPWERQGLCVEGDLCEHGRNEVLLLKLCRLAQQGLAVLLDEVRVVLERAELVVVDHAAHESQVRRQAEDAVVLQRLAESVDGL